MTDPTVPTGVAGPGRLAQVLATRGGRAAPEAPSRCSMTTERYLAVDRCGHIGLRPSTKPLPEESSNLKLGCMTVETHPEPGIYLHLTTPTGSGFSIIEVWDEKSGFDRFVEARLVPADEAIGLQRETAITVTPLHDLLGARLAELPGLVGTLPGAPHSGAAQ
jgi:hypothetical protein